MFEIYKRLAAHNVTHIDDRIELDHAEREKGRFKAKSHKGIECRIFLDRGHRLEVGEILQTSCGKNIVIDGAHEDVTTAHTDNWEAFSKACYHLGNRHVKLQVGNCWLRITPDSVLEQMLEKLGLSLTQERVVFTPEPGAYSQIPEAAGHHHHH